MRLRRLVNDRRGMTLLEVTIAAGLLTMVTIGLVSMMIQSLRGWNSGTSGDTATSRATVAIQRVANDIRDGRSAQVSSGVLTVTFPRAITDATTGERIYDLSANDPATRSYYVSNGELVRRVSGVSTVLCQDVQSVSFRAWGGTVTITTLTSSDQEGTHTDTQTVTGSVALRNFKN